MRDLQVEQVAQADLLLVGVVIFEFPMLDGKDPDEPGQFQLTNCCLGRRAT